MSEKSNEKTGESSDAAPDAKPEQSVGDIIGNLIESVTEVVSDVIETIEHGVETILRPTENLRENAEIKETEIVKETETVNVETRVGYQSGLPQAEEPEEETVTAAAQPDAQKEVEAAIAKARETNSETFEKDELVTEFLPELPRKDVAKLYLQSPNRIFLYWSITGNPFETLQKAFGSRANNYQFVTRLINLQTNAESFAPAEFEGNWWYNVRSNTDYRVDLGFYSFNRPFIRLLSSNVVKTPRAAPSSRADTAADWVVSTNQFVQVLTASGYSHDVLEVAFETRDEMGEISATDSTLAVANRLAPIEAGDLNLAELRWLLISLARGASLGELQNLLSPATLTWLEKVLAANENALEPENVRQVLEAIFGSEFVETFAAETVFEHQRLASVAIGASAIHFPEILFPQLRFPALRAAVNPFGESENLEKLFPTSAEFINE